jgi:hypothetical protein
VKVPEEGVLKKIEKNIEETVKSVKTVVEQPSKLSIENFEKAINIDNFDEEIKDSKNKKRHRSNDEKLNKPFNKIIESSYKIKMKDFDEKYEEELEEAEYEFDEEEILSLSIE